MTDIQRGDIVDHKSDRQWRYGKVHQLLGDRVYVLWPENGDNGYEAYSPHPLSQLKRVDEQMSLF